MCAFQTTREVQDIEIIALNALSMAFCCKDRKQNGSLWRENSILIC